MESRGSPPKTFRERLSAINFPDDKIPEAYIDHYVTLDIMQNPIKVYGSTSGEFIMDHSSMAKFTLKKLQQWNEKTKGGTLFYDATEESGFESIGGGHDPMSKWEYMRDLRSEIEVWVTKQETLYLIEQIEEETRKRQEEEAKRFHQEILIKQQTRLEENQKKLTEIDLLLETNIIKLHALLHPDCHLSTSEKEERLEEQLSFIETLNRQKDKLSQGRGYYANPENLEYEIDRLNRKKEMHTMAEEELKDFYFNEEDEKELAYCYQCLDTRSFHRLPGSLFRPGAVPPISNPEPFSLPSLIRLNRSEEQ